MNNMFAAGQDRSTPSSRDAARLRVLGCLRREGPLARVELSRMTGMSPASVSALTAQLVSEGILQDLQESERDQGPRGRPRVRLGFAPDVGGVAGVWVGLDHVELTLVNYAGQRVASRSVHLPLRHAAGERVGPMLAALIEALLRDNRETPPIRGIGIAFQGFVDATSGTVVWSPVLADRDVPVGADVARLTGLPTLVENDASAMAYAVVRRDADLRTGCTACLMVGDGVGLGLVLDGRVYRGARSGGSEFGHVRLSPGGPQCRCGGLGCLEAYLADYALYRDAQAVHDLPPPEGRLPSEADMQGIVDQASAGAAPLAALFDRAGAMLAGGAGIIIQMLEPSNLVICGPGMRAAHLLRPSFERGLEPATIAELRRLTRITFLEHDPRLLTEGVELHALERLDEAIGLGE